MKTDTTTTFSLKQLFFWFTLLALFVAVLASFRVRPPKRPVLLLQGNLNAAVVEVEQLRSIPSSSIHEIYIYLRMQSGKSAQRKFTVDASMQVRETKLGTKYFFVYLERDRGGDRSIGIAFDTNNGQIVVQPESPDLFAKIEAEDFEQ